MKRIETQSVADVLRQAIEESDLEETLAEYRAAAAWPLVVGRHLADLTGKPVVSRGVLSVSVRSSALRQELTMQRSRLRELLNKAAGAEAIRELRFIS